MKKLKNGQVADCNQSLPTRHHPVKLLFLFSEMRPLQGYVSYLTSEHGTEVIATGGQHDPMGREVLLLHSQGHVTQGVALPEGVHRVEDGFGVCVCHDVFGGHNASHQAKCRNNERGPWILEIQEEKTMSTLEGLGKRNIFK